MAAIARPAEACVAASSNTTPGYKNFGPHINLSNFGTGNLVA